MAGYGWNSAVAELLLRCAKVAGIFLMRKNRLAVAAVAACAVVPFLRCASASDAPAHNVYYVAANGSDEADGRTASMAWRTLEKLNASLPAGAEVRLRRGDVFYGPLRIKSGSSANRPTVVTSFGEGVAPVISLYKVAVHRPSTWHKVGDNLWQIDLYDDGVVVGNPVKNGNVGFLLVDGKIHGAKLFGDAQPSKQWEFKDDQRRLTVWSAQNPSELSSDIRFAPCVDGIKLVRNAVVSNVTVCGTGAHGAGGVGENMVFRDCTFKEIGGSWLISYPTPGVRYGNGVECWACSTRILVERCRFVDIYDVAFTMQGPNHVRSWEDVHVRDCEIVRCTQAFEVWTRKCRSGIGMKNCSFVRNRCIDTGYCWGYDVRNNKNVSAPLLVYSMETDICDILIEGNTFINNRQYLIFKSRGIGLLPEGYRVSGNRIVNREEKPVGNKGGKEQAVRASMIEAAIRAGNVFSENADRQI